MKHTLFAVLLVPLILGVPAFAATPTAAENAMAEKWMQNALLTDKPGKPFSFVCDGKPSSVLLGGWEFAQTVRALDAQRREHTLTWTDQATGLQVRPIAVEYVDFPVVEWTVYLKNTGKEPMSCGRRISGARGIWRTICRASTARSFSFGSSRVAPLMLGDYYPLTPDSLETNNWIAWQFHRPDWPIPESNDENDAFHAVLLPVAGSIHPGG